METMEQIDKVVCLGTSQTYGGRHYRIYCHIRFGDGKLSITGVEGPLANGNCLGECGQIDMHLRDAQSTIKLEKGWNKAMLEQFFNIWQEWHLNTLHAGCEHQRQNKTEDFCEVCQYKSGSKWLTKEVPVAVLQFLTQLPETTHNYAWV